MSKREERFHGRTTFGIVAFGVIAACASACGPNQGGLAGPTTGEGGSGGSTGDSSGSSGRATAGTSNTGGSGMSSSTGGAPGTGGTGEAGRGGMGGDPGDAGPQIPACVFHTDPVVEAGVSPFVVFASDGGADASEPDAQSPASEGGGPIDGAGRTLYVYDADTKGTATSDPTSACADACLTMHPAFRRNRISVVSSLEPTDFTIFVQGPLGQQVAYRGAPLYYSSDDLRSGDQKGATTPGLSIAIP